VADDDDLATPVEAAAGVPFAALDGARDELGAVGAVGAVSAETETPPQVAVHELDLSAALDVAGGEPEDRAALVEVVERGVDAGHDLVGGLEEKLRQVCEVALEEAFDVLGAGGAADGGLEDVLDEPRVGLAGEADAPKDRLDAEDVDGGTRERAE